VDNWIHETRESIPRYTSPVVTDQDKGIHAISISKVRTREQRLGRRCPEEHSEGQEEEKEQKQEKQEPY